MSPDSGRDLSRQAGSPRISRGELLIAAAASALTAVLQFLPLATNLGSVVPGDLGDPLPQTWQVAWGGHALLTQPLAFWQANQFWPAADSLAFSDALVGYAPAGLIGSGPTAAVARYGLLFMLSFAMAMFGAWLLARELGAGRWGSAAAGAAFAFSPWRMEQAGHLHVVTSGGVPLSLFLLLRGYRRGNPKLIVGGYAAAAWQVSIGFTIGIQLLYLLAAIAVVAAVIWLKHGRPAQSAAVIGSSLFGLALLGATCLALGIPYLRVQERYSAAERSLATVASFSPGFKAFVTPPEPSLLWSSVSRPLRNWNTFGLAEKTLFPGLVVVLLALLGLVAGTASRRVRVALGGSVVIFFVLSLGVHAGTLGMHLPYRYVHDLLPGWAGVRTPGRIHTLTTLALALLAGLGTNAIASRVRARRGLVAGNAIAGVVALLVLIEGSGIPFPLPPAPVAPAGLAGLKAPLLELPAGPWDNRRYLLWSTDGFPQMINGRSSIAPPFFSRALAATRNFPDEASVSWLRRHGVRTVVVHTTTPALAALQQRESISREHYEDSLTSTALRPIRDNRPTWEQAIAAPLPAELGVTRQLRRPIVIYRLG